MDGAPFGAPRRRRAPGRAPLEDAMVKAALQRVALEPRVVVVNLDGCQTEAQAEARLRFYRERIERLPICVVLWATRVEARFTKAGNYAPAGLRGQADLHAEVKPTGRACWFEAKRDDPKAKQGPCQVQFEGIVTGVGSTYDIFRTPDELLSLVRAELHRAETTLRASRCDATALEG